MCVMVVGWGGERDRKSMGTPEREKEKEHTHAAWGAGWRGGELEGERERARALGSSFYMFSSPWACPMQMGLSEERCSTCSPHSSPRTFL